jgi:protein-disulfide isomerase
VEAPAPPAIEPPPPEPPPQAPAPQPPPTAGPVPPPTFAPPASKRGGGSLWPIFAMLGGVVLMFAGVFGLFAWAMLRTSPAPVAPPTVATVAPPFPTAPVFDAGVPELDAGSTSTDAGELAIETGDGGVPSIRFTAVDDGSGPLPVTPNAAIWGDKGALVTIVWFGDLECPHTRNSYRVIEAVLRAFTGEVRVVWRHRPLSIHSHAKDAAKVAAGIEKELGEAAFWRFISAVSGDARDAERARLEQWAERAGAEPIRVSAWLASRETEREVERDLELAGTFDVRATPTFFVNGVRVEGTRSFDDMKAIVQKELAASRGLAALGTEKSIYAARVRKNLTGLGADVAARTCPVIGTSPARGASDALVTIVEFSDFECQYCKQAQPTLDTLLARFGGDVRHVWKNFPLSMHPRAIPAANFALEARTRGGDTTFWKVHDLLFSEQKNLDDEAFESIAKRAGLPPDKLLDAVQSQAHKAVINADMEQGKRFGVRGTPSFFVNGRQIAGALPVDKFQAVVTEELETARRLVKSGTSRSRVYDAVCGVR